MLGERTSDGLEIHTRSVVAQATDTTTGEVFTVKVDPTRSLPPLRSRDQSKNPWIVSEEALNR